MYEIIWIACVALGWVIGNSKGRPKAGFWFGLLLGILGLVCVICMKPAAEMDRRGLKYIDKPKVTSGV